MTAGGRVLNVTALGPTPGEARERAYEAAGLISFDGMQMRTDIAARAVETVRRRPAAGLRENPEGSEGERSWR